MSETSEKENYLTPETFEYNRERDSFFSANCEKPRAEEVEEDLDGRTERDEEDDEDSDDDDGFAGIPMDVMEETMEMAAIESEVQILSDKNYFIEVLEGLSPSPVFDRDTFLEDVRYHIHSLAMCSPTTEGKMEMTPEMLVMLYNQLTNPVNNKGTVVGRKSHFDDLVEAVVSRYVEDEQLIELIRNNRTHFFTLDIFKDIIHVEGSMIRPILSTDRLRDLAQKLKDGAINANKALQIRQEKKRRVQDEPKNQLRMMYSCNFLMKLIHITTRWKLENIVSWDHVRVIYDEMQTEKANESARELFHDYKDKLPLEANPILNQTTLKALSGRSGLAKALSEPIFSKKIGFIKAVNINLQVFLKEKLYTKAELAAMQKRCDEFEDQQKKPNKKAMAMEEKAKNFKPFELVEDSQPEIAEPQAVFVAEKAVERRRERISSPVSAQEEEPNIPEESGNQHEKKMIDRNFWHRPVNSNEDETADGPKERESAPMVKNGSPIGRSTPSPPVVVQKKAPVSQPTVEKKSESHKPTTSRKKEVLYTDEEDFGCEEVPAEPERPRKISAEQLRKKSPAEPNFFSVTKSTTLKVEMETKTGDFTAEWMKPVVAGREQPKNAAMVLAEADEPLSSSKLKAAPPETRDQKTERIQKFIETSGSSKNSEKAVDKQMRGKEEEMNSSENERLPPVFTEGDFCWRPQMPNEPHPLHIAERDKKMQEQRELNLQQSKAKKERLISQVPLDPLKFVKDPKQRMEILKQRQEDENEKRQRERREMEEQERRQREDEEKRMREREEFDKKNFKATIGRLETREIGEPDHRSTPKQRSSAFHQQAENQPGFRPPVHPQSEYRQGSLRNNSREFYPDDYYNQQRSQHSSERNSITGDSRRYSEESRQQWEFPPSNQRPTYDDQPSQRSSYRGSPPQNNFYRENPQYYHENPMYQQSRPQTPPSMYHSSQRAPEFPPASFGNRSSSASSHPNRVSPPRDQRWGGIEQREDYDVNLAAHMIAEAEIASQRSAPHSISPQQQFLNFFGSYIHAYRNKTDRLRWSFIREGLSEPLNNPEKIFRSPDWINMVCKHLPNVKFLQQKNGDYIFIYDSS